MQKGLANMKVKLHATGELLEEIRAALKESKGHCPCVLEECRNKDTLCMCKIFRDAPAGTICHCGLYIKLEA